MITLYSNEEVMDVYCKAIAAFNLQNKMQAIKQEIEVSENPDVIDELNDKLYRLVIEYDEYLADIEKYKVDASNIIKSLQLILEAEDFRI